MLRADAIITVLLFYMLQKVMNVMCWHILSHLVTTFITGIFRCSLNHHYLSSFYGSTAISTVNFELPWWACTSRIGATMSWAMAHLNSLVKPSKKNLHKFLKKMLVTPLCITLFNSIFIGPHGGCRVIKKLLYSSHSWNCAAICLLSGNQNSMLVNFITDLIQLGNVMLLVDV